MDDVSRRVEVAERAARAGGEVAAEFFRGPLDVSPKGESTDLVTEADHAAQERVIEAISEAYPDDTIVAEEGEERKTVPEEGPAWVIDPIDGTHNFVRGVRTWATSVAATIDGESVAAATVLPALSDRFLAGPDGTRMNGEPVEVSERTDLDRFTVCPTVWWGFDRRDEYAAAAREIVGRFGDMRRYGCAQAELAMAAAGGLEGVITNLTPNPWDSVAGAHMVRQAGGVVTDLEGERWRHDSAGFVASNGTAHDEVLGATQRIVDG